MAPISTTAQRGGPGRDSDSATGVRVSILTCLLAGAAAALWPLARREGLCSQVLRPREFRV